MGPPLADHELAQGRSAGPAGLAVAAVDLELVLVAARLPLGGAVEGVEGGALALDGLRQDPANLGVQARGVRGPQAVRAPQGVQARAKEGLVDVDVAQAGQEALVEQERLEGPAAGLQGAPEPLGAEALAQGLGAEPRQDRIAVVHGQEAAELAHVDEDEGPAALQLEPHALVGAGLRAHVDHVQTTGHAQVHDQVPRGSAPALEVEDDVLGPTPYASDAPAAHALLELRGRHAPHRARPADLGAAHELALDPGADQARDGLDLRQLGHGGRA